MEFLYYRHLDDEEILKQVWQLLCKHDHDFIPALSARENTFQPQLNIDDENSNLPIAYFNKMKEQEFIIALDNDKLAGFMSFIYDFTNDELKDSLKGRLSNYVTTVIVDENYRGRGLSNSFYNYMENKLPKDKAPKAITTRTWATNYAHIKILTRRGFKEAARIKDGRAKDLDTVYYYKIIS